MGLTRQQLIMVATLLAGALLVVLNQTLLSPALPVIMADLQVDATTVQWLTSGYALVEAVVIPLSAFFIGRFRTRQLFICGLSLFAAGSLVAAMSPMFGFLLLGRVMQAASTGVVMPMVFTIIMLSFPRERRGQAMGIVGLIIAFAPAIGPCVSGILVDSVGWRILFIIVTVIALIVIAAAFFVLTDKEGFDRTTFDIPSVILSTLGMVSLLYGLSTFSSSDNVALTVVLIVIGLALIGVFVWRQSKLEVPLLKVDVLKTRRYRTAAILVFLMQCGLVGGTVLMPIYLQNVLNQTATVSGFVMLPGAVLGAVASLLSGRLFDKNGIRGLALGGGAAMALSGIGLITFGTDTSVFYIAAVYTVMVIGMQFLMTPLNTWGVNSLDNRVIQHGNAVTNTLNQVGASLGTALIVSFSAMYWLVSPDAVTNFDQVAAGVHVSFIVQCAILVLVFVLIVFLARDKASDVDPRKASRSSLVHDPDMHQWKVSDVMAGNPTFVRQDAPIREAVALMSSVGVNGLIVVDGAGKPVGFLSDGDIMKALSNSDGSYTDGWNMAVIIDSTSLQEKVVDMLDRPVLDYATKKLVSVEADWALEHGLKVLADRNIKKAPVIADGNLVGVLRRRDVINAIAKVNHL